MQNNSIHEASLSMIILLFIVGFFKYIFACSPLICIHGNCNLGICECYPGWNNLNCTNIIECSPVCGSGLCADGSCIGIYGWTGNECKTKDKCDHKCVNGLCNNKECICRNGWTGVSCKTLINNSEEISILSIVLIVGGATGGIFACISQIKAYKQRQELLNNSQMEFNIVVNDDNEQSNNTSTDDSFQEDQINAISAVPSNYRNSMNTIPPKFRRSTSSGLYGRRGSITVILNKQSFEVNPTNIKPVNRSNSNLTRNKFPNTEGSPK